MKPEEIFSRGPEEAASEELVFAGTRVPVKALVDHLKSGEPINDFYAHCGFRSAVSREQAVGFLEWALEVARRQAGADSQSTTQVESFADTRTTGDAPSPEERVRARALEFFEGDQWAANRWLSFPRPVLGGATPLEMARTEAGARKVESLILGLELGVFF